MLDRLIPGSMIWLDTVKPALLSLWMIGSLGVALPLARALTAVWTYRRRHPALYRHTGLGRERRGLLRIAARPLAHLREELDVAELRIEAESVMLAMLVLLLIGFFGSDALLQAMSRQLSLGTVPLQGGHLWSLSGMIGVLAGAVPYFLIRFRVMRKRQGIAIRMIMLVQNLIGHYRARLTLADMIVSSTDTMPDEVRAEWRRLELGLHMKSIDQALYEFARRVDNEWAHDLTDLLLIGAQYGTDMTESLHHLVNKMQASKRHEDNRLAMITVYRLGTTFMVAFAFFVIGFNVYADPINYSRYFVEPGGQLLLVLAFAIMFISMVLVIRTGKKAY
jgi:Flp pilus assembly protein TadB